MTSQQDAPTPERARIPAEIGDVSAARALPIAGAARRPPGMSLLASHDAASLVTLLLRAGETAHAAERTAAIAIRHAFGKHGSRVWTFDALRDLQVSARASRVLLELDPTPSLRVAERVPSSDGTLRLLLEGRDGSLIESVIIPKSADPQQDASGRARTTLCVSSQVGCARACSFCETGERGLQRQLAAGEIVDQVRVAIAEHAARGMSPPISNLVVMGMGEPFDNLPEVLRAVRLLADGRAFGLAPARITVSTVGVADKIPAYFAGTNARLAVSLNAPDDARRRRIMPVTERFPMAVLREALRLHVPQGQKVLLEYVLFDRFNDAPEDADLLAEYVAGLRCRVNVIPANPGPDPSLRPPIPERVNAFVARLSERRVTALVRRPRGRDVSGACGQLAGTRDRLARPEP